jgi:hypothetical protein
MFITYIMSNKNITKADLLNMYKKMADSAANTPQIGDHPEYVQTINGKLNRPTDFMPKRIKPSKAKFMEVKIKKGGSPDVYGCNDQKQLFRSQEYDGKGLLGEEEEDYIYSRHPNAVNNLKAAQNALEENQGKTFYDFVMNHSDPYEYGSREDLKNLVLAYLMKDAIELNRNRSLSCLDVKGSGYQDEYNGSMQTPEITPEMRRQALEQQLKVFRPPVKKDMKVVLNPSSIIVPELNMADKQKMYELDVAKKAEFDKTHGRGLVGARMKKVKNPTRVASSKMASKKNSWINFVKEYSAETGIPYKDCIKDRQCKKEYQMRK